MVERPTVGRTLWTTGPDGLRSPEMVVATAIFGTRDRPRVAAVSNGPPAFVLDLDQLFETQAEAEAAYRAATRERAVALIEQAEELVEGKAGDLLRKALAVLSGEAEGLV